jgi:hypothetical protein
MLRCPASPKHFRSTGLAPVTGLGILRMSRARGRSDRIDLRSTIASQVRVSFRACRSISK